MSGMIGMAKGDVSDRRAIAASEPARGLPHDAVRPSGISGPHWATKASASAIRHLGKHSAGTFTRNFAQGIIDSFR